MVGRDLRTERRGGTANELEEEGGAAASRRGAVSDANEATFEQLPCDRGDGRRTEPKPPRDLVAGDQACAPDQSQDRSPIEISTEPRGSGAEAQARQARCDIRSILNL